MGVNYYAVKKKRSTHRPVIHLGKSSWGWRFAFAETYEVRDYPSFLKWLEENVDSGEYVIMTENDEDVSKEYLLGLIAERQKHDLHKENLLRHHVRDGYVFIEGEFS